MGSSFLSLSFSFFLAEPRGGRSLGGRSRLRRRSGGERTTDVPCPVGLPQRFKGGAAANPTTSKASRERVERSFECRRAICRGDAAGAAAAMGGAGEGGGHEGETGEHASSGTTDGP